MEGPEYAGGLAGKAAIKGVLADRQLQVATRGLPHCIPGLFTIESTTSLSRRPGRSSTSLG